MKKHEDLRINPFQEWGKMEYPLAMTKHTQEELEPFVEGGPKLL